MKNQRKYTRKKTAIILGSALCAAAWLIAGPDVLKGWGITGTSNQVLVWMPTMVLFFASIASDKQMLACEARAFRRLLGKSEPRA